MKADEIPDWAKPDWAKDEMFDEVSRKSNIESWADFEAAYERYFLRKRGRWYFRGQQDSAWRIETTLDRLLMQIGQPVISEPFPHYPSGRPGNTLGTRVELILLRAFQARASKYFPNLPQPDDTLGWFALMRHYGLPSRLLDVTTSPFVALYFALVDLLRCKKSELNAVRPVVWAINHIPLRALEAEHVGVEPHTDLSDTSLFNSAFLSDPAKAFVAPVHPRSHSERLAAQQGTFLCVGDVDLPFEANISKDVEDLRVQGVFRRLEINPEAAIDMLARLSAMNIHRASLFPDLEGYAQFVADSLRLFGKDHQQERHLDFESLERLGWLG